VRLFAPLSADDARAAERGERLAAREIHFADRAVMDEAEEDAVWVALEFEESDLRRFERPAAEELGYREFALPSEVVMRGGARRVIPHTPDWWGHFGSLRTLLLYEWDPIGVIGMADLDAIHDEYDNYLGPIASLLDRGASTDRLTEYLSSTRTATMGLRPDLDQDRRVAEMLADWHRRICES
jgi:hypothetical protein